MSLAKRIFGGFRTKKDGGEEPSPPTPPPPPPKGAKAPPPPPKVSRAEPDLEPAREEKRSQTYTFHIGAPQPAAAQPPVVGEAAQGPSGRRLTPLRTSEHPATHAAAADPMRRSQTIRVAPPSAGESTDREAGPDIVVQPDGLRRSQTIRVTPPGTGASTHQEVAPDIVVQPDGLRRSQTFRVAPPPGPVEEAAVGDAPALPRVPLRRESIPPVPGAAGVTLPLEALLAGVPPGFRGPAWSPDLLPEGTLTMAPEVLRRQLAAGRCYVGVDEARRSLPQGWIDAGAVGEFDLDMECVLAALPPGFVPAREVVAEVDAGEGVDSCSEPGPAATPGGLSDTGPEAGVAEPGVARLPWSTVLVGVPAGLRGPAWREGNIPSGAASVPKDLLMEQLRSGRVSLDIAMLAPSLPAGWIAPQAQGSVVLDLAAVVSALPPDWLQAETEEDDEVRKAEAMADLFQPQAAAQPEPAAPPTEPTAPLPAGLVLAALPAAMRGPGWSETAPEGAVVQVPCQTLLPQLATGRIELELGDLVEQLPAASCREGARGTVTLDLGLVVAALPPELLSVPGELAEDVAAVAGMGDLFAAAGAQRPAAPVTPPRVETVALPCGVVLSALPLPMRGPAWRPDGFPEASIELPKADVLAQLSAGSMQVSVATLASAVPPGWLAPDAQGAVPLNLADVVAALPPEMLAPAGEMAEEVEEVAGLGALFGVAAKAAKPVSEQTAAAAATPEAAVATPEAAAATPEAMAATPEAAAATPEAVVPVAAAVALAAASVELAQPPPEESHRIRPVVPDGATEEDGESAEEGLEAWEGVECSLETAPLGVDINTARAGELMLLPGVGETRARAVIEHRAAQGPFRSIYDLAAVPGFGPMLFRRVTGLSARRRVNRHRVMEQYLPLPAEGPALLHRITEAVRAEFSAAGALLTNRAGMPIAVAGTMPEADKYAALGSRYFFRTRRQLQKFVDRASDCIILPGSTPPLLLLSSDDVVMILSLAGSAVSPKRLNRVRRAMREIGWLVSRRAVVLRL
jgi:competence protein ComEA